MTGSSKRCNTIFLNHFFNGYYTEPHNRHGERHKVDEWEEKKELWSISTYFAFRTCPLAPCFHPFGLRMFFYHIIDHVSSGINQLTLYNIILSLHTWSWGIVDRVFLPVSPLPWPPTYKELSRGGIWDRFSVGAADPPGWFAGKHLREGSPLALCQAETKIIKLNLN